MYIARNTSLTSTYKVHTLARKKQPNILSTFHVQNINNITLKTILKQQSTKDTTPGLECVDFSDCHLKLAGIVRKQQTKKELVQYLYATFLASIKSTYVKIMRKNNYFTWPGLITDLMNKHCTPSIPMAQGNLNRESKNLQSTKQKTTVKHVKFSSSFGGNRSKVPCQVTIYKYCSTGSF